MHDEDKAELKAAQPNKRDELKRCFNGMASWPEGLAVLREIHRLTGHNQKCMRFDPATGEINAYASVYNQGRQELWLGVRELLTPEILAKIENHQED